MSFMYRVLRSKTCLRRGPGPSRNPKRQKRGQGWTAGCWVAQTRVELEPGTQGREAQKAWLPYSMRGLACVQRGPSSPSALHTQAAHLRERTSSFCPKQILHLVVEWGQGSRRMGSSADPSLKRENPGEPIHKQQARSLGPIRCASGGFNGSFLSSIPN